MHRLRRQHHQWITLATLLLLVFVIMWLLFDWLATPSSLMALVLLGIAASPWLIPLRRVYRRWSIPFVVLISLYLIGTSPLALALAQHGLVAFLPQDSGATVEAVVVLGRGPDFNLSRSEAATKLWKGERATAVFASGMTDAPQILETMQSMGVAAQALTGERCSQSTLENVLFTTAILRPRGVRRILLVTDAPHLWRSFLLFRSYGFEVIPVAVPLPENRSYSATAASIGREYLALLSYLVQGQFRSRSPDEILHLPPYVQETITDWGCQLDHPS